MINYLLSRIAQALAVMVAVAFVSFVLFNFVGDPVNNMVGQEATPETRERIRDELGLNDPFIVQFGTFAKNVLSGDFGMSLKHRRPVEVMVAERLPATLELVFASAVLALLFGVTAGVYTGLHGRSVIGRKVTWPAAIASRSMLTFSLIGVSLPTFVIGIVLIYIFSVELRWLPSFGRGETVALGWWTTGFLTVSGWKALVLPSITLALFQLTLIMRLVRSEMLEVLRTDYIKFRPCAGPQRPRRALRPRAQEHPDTRHHDHRSAARFAGGLLHHHRDGLPVARHGLAVRAGGRVRGRAGHGRLPGHDRRRVRVHQPRGRPALLRGRPAPARGPQRDRTLGRMTTMMRLLKSDIAYSFVRSPVTVISALITLVYFAAAIFAPLVAPHTPFIPESLDLMDAFTPPVWSEDGVEAFALGTDDQGRDILSTIIYGSRISLLVGFGAVALAIVIGVLLGVISGYVGGVVDSFIMRLADIQLTVPGILVALAIGGAMRVYFIEAGQVPADVALYVLILSIGLSEWPQYARVVRGAAMVERNKEYVAAARVIGVHPVRIMLGHVLPNVLGPVLVLGTIGLALAIITEASLSFLGVGMPPTTPSLGTLIRVGFGFLFSGEWWITLFPAAALVVLVLSVNLLGDWLRDALNPKLR